MSALEASYWPADDAYPVLDLTCGDLLRQCAEDSGDVVALAEVALPGLLRIAQQLPWITDSFSTNSHFCVSLVELADALVLGHVGDDLTLNETTRRFLDEDEFLVRRRVHRDVGSTS